LLIALNQYFYQHLPCLVSSRSIGDMVHHKYIVFTCCWRRQSSLPSRISIGKPWFSRGKTCLAYNQWSSSSRGLHFAPCAIFISPQVTRWGRRQGEVPYLKTQDQSGKAFRRYQVQKMSYRGWKRQHTKNGFTSWRTWSRYERKTQWLEGQTEYPRSVSFYEDKVQWPL
jgi:hypothetical protein